MGDIDAQAVSLLIQLLNFDPKARISAAVALVRFNPLNPSFSLNITLNPKDTPILGQIS